MVLHITNGDCAGARIAECQLGGDVLCWCDVLHDGPVPAGLSHEALTELRASFLAERGWAALEEVTAKFACRDGALRCARTYGNVVLWFEHDLYDQLQLLQVLDWFAREGVGWTAVWLVQAEDYLGSTSPDTLREWFGRRTQVTREQYQLARDAWEAFRAPEPTGLESYFAGGGVLPRLGPALRRFAEEYPWVGDGLSRTERTILALIAEGVSGRAELFRGFSEREDPRFMGDWSFFWRLDELKTGPRPLVTDGHTLTEFGKAVLEGRADRLQDNGIDRWLGGVHLEGETATWRWNPAEGRFQFHPESRRVTTPG